MPWPSIFFRARKPLAEAEPPPQVKSPPENKKPVSSPPQPPAIQPVPSDAKPKAVTAPASPGPTTSGTSGPTLPAIHGVVLRPPAKLASSSELLQNPAASRPAVPLKNIEELMAEADPVHTLRQTGNLRILKPLSQDSAPVTLPAKIAPETTPLPPGPSLSSVAATSSNPPASAAPSVPVPLETVVTSHPAEEKKSDPEPKADSAPAPAAKAIPMAPISTAALDLEDDSPFILKPAAPPEPVLKVLPPTAPSLMPFGSIFRRKAKMTDVARIVLPPKRDESQPLPLPSEPSPTVVPPAFPVAAMTARVSQAEAVQEKADASPSAPEKIVLEEKPSGAVDGGSAPGDVAPLGKTEVPSPDKTPGAASPPEKPAGSAPEIAANPPPADEAKPAPSPDASPDAPKAAPKPAAELSVPSAPREKREFHLANGERVVGVVLSETPEAVYIEHGTLGVLTIPRANIAKRLVEIILINGDRIVGDIMAETADTLYVRHASLGMLTVPRAQRSTRVVEAILKDGDRILGEVLTETDTFTVIRSATLGTITIPHGKMAMLNRKIEQIELKALPPPAAEIKEGRPSA